MILRVVAVVALAALALNVAGVRAAAPGLDPNDLDRTCPACRDFYQFAAGGWRKRNPVPPQYGTWSQDNIIAQRVQDRLRTTLETAQREAAGDGADPDMRRLGLFYKSCMDTAGIEAAGTGPIAAKLTAIDAIRDREGVVAAAASINAIGGNALFQYSSAQDLRDSTRVVGELDQGGLGLPDRDYYTRTDAKSRALLDEYRTLIATQFENLGDSPAVAKRNAATVLAIETGLARGQLTNVQLRDPHAVDHPMTRTAR